MSGVMLGTKPRHPVDKKLSEALAEDADRIKARKGLIDKTATLVKAPDEESDANADLGATMRPTDEQVERINQFSRRAVTADEVVAFVTLSCNDIPDRDDDQFSTQCVKDFSELPQPFSPTGKSFMIDHAYSVGNAVGRIFGTDTKKVSGALFLTNEVYIPNTPKNAGFIEDIDFGINWAVSVGVMLGKDECSVCKSPFSSYGWWCTEGHDKGMSYDPSSEETDSWGYPLPCDPSAKGAIKCLRIFSEPRDMYELSQVFLGAQYFAALEKQPDFASVMKSVSDSGIPTIGLSTDEAKTIEFRREPKKLHDARLAGVSIKEADDGSLLWTDADGLRWNFDPEDPDAGITSLGKATNQEEENDGEHPIPEGGGSADPGAVDGGLGDPSAVGRSAEDLPDEGGDVEGGGPSPEGSLNKAEDDEEADEPESDPDDDDEEDKDEEESSDEEDDSDNDTEEAKAVNKKAVLAAAKKAKLPKSVIDAVEEAAGDGLSAALTAANKELSKLNKEVTALTSKASLGDQFLKELRVEAIDWYVKANRTTEGKGVSTETFERLLDKCGEDVDLIKSLTEQQADIARAKFPKAVARSSFPDDPNVSAPDSGRNDGTFEEGTSYNDERVHRIHG